jgi:hypothetical protein
MRSRFSVRQSLTRQALYDLIWETPMKRLGPELGLTASQLSLICNQYEIDKPGYGYWTLRDMGRPVVKPPLGPTTRGADDLVSLDPPATTQRPVVRRPVGEKPKAVPRPPKPSPTNAPPRCLNLARRRRLSPYRRPQSTP